MDTIRIFELKGMFDTITQMSTIKLPILLSYKISKLMKEAEKDVEFYNKKLSEIIKAYAEVDEAGQIVYLDKNSIKIQKGNEEECQKELIALDNLMVSLPTIKLTMTDLETLNSHIELTLNETNALLPIIEE